MADLLAYMTSTGLLDEAELQDPEYDEYCQQVEDPGTYEEWQDMRAEWKRLMDKYAAKYQHLPENEYFAEPNCTEANRLLIRMSEIEAAQGY
jgi:hypothetical protein